MNKPGTTTNIIVFIIMLLFPVFLTAQKSNRLPVKGIDINVSSKPVIKSAGQALSLQENGVSIQKLSDILYYVKATIVLSKDVLVQDINLPVSISVKDKSEMEKIKSSFHWMPNMKTNPEQIIAQHVFRSPALIFCLNEKSISVIPDLNLLKKNTNAPYYLDMKYEENAIKIYYGLANYKVARHQYYEKDVRSFHINKPLNFGFYILISNSSDALSVLKKTNHFLWSKYAQPYTESYLPQTLTFEQYADTGYSMALKHYWVDVSEDKGGITLSTYYDSATQEYKGRDSKDDLWFHSWFNNIRTAYGLFYWGNQLSKKEWQQKAISCIRLLMSAPKDNGWFPTVYDKQQNKWIASGQGGGEELYHVPDNIWTAYWLMRFNDEMQKIEGTDKFLSEFSDAVLKTQQDDGSFPERITVSGHQADAILRSAASSAIQTWFLEEMLLRNKIADADIEKYKSAILRSLNFLSTNILPLQKFEDFEVYLSCSPKSFMPYYDSSTAMYAQNTLSIQWCAEAFLKAYQLFGNDKKFLAQGEYCLNILNLYQQVWNPPYISFYAFGGFGAQNSDAEWSDARQAQFAETYLNYYAVTSNKEYIERAVYACRASFALMVLPENKNVSPNNYLGTPINGEYFAGNMAENYGHDGYDQRSHQSGFHWGTGSALTTAAIFKNKLGDLYIDNSKKFAIGVNAVVIKKSDWKKAPSFITKKIFPNQSMRIISPGKKPMTILMDGKLITVQGYKP
ncbi:MAG TPA: hypothetical protein VKT28_15015 [Puia sp.]|nr:hypothetical protein [Puia sp.]